MTVLGLYWLKSMPYSARNIRKIACKPISGAPPFLEFSTTSPRGLLINSKIASAMSQAGRLRSTNPVSRALRGIPSNRDDSSDWATIRPPASWISRIPLDPSLPVPDRMTPTDRLPES